MTGFKKYLKIFTTCMYLSAFTYGGGYVIVPLMKKKFVEQLKWLEEQEVVDMIAIAQSSPGAIVVNTALLLGFRVGGPLGGLAALFGIILPPIFIVSLVSAIYGFFHENPVVHAVLKGMQAGVAALIIDVAYKLVWGVAQKRDVFLILIMVTAFVLIFVFEINVAFIILGCVALGVLSWAAGLLIKHKKKPKDKQAPPVKQDEDIEL